MAGACHVKTAAEGGRVGGPEPGCTISGGSETGDGVKNAFNGPARV